MKTTNILILADAHCSANSREISALVHSVVQAVAPLAIDEVWLAGDMGEGHELVVERLLQAFSLNSLRAVAGNHDVGVRSLVRCQTFTCSGWRVALVHGNTDNLRERISRLISKLSRGRARVLGPIHSDLMRQCPGADLVVYGHLHWPETHRRDETVFVNPGPATRLQGWRFPASVSVLSLTSSGICIRTIAVEGKIGGPSVPEVLEEVQYEHPSRYSRPAHVGSTPSIEPAYGIGRR